MRNKGRPGTSGSVQTLDRRAIAHLHQRANPSFDQGAADSTAAMSSGGLQIWPKVSPLPSREPREHGQGLLANRSASNSITASDSGTFRSFYDPSRAPLAVSQQTSASAVRDRALRKGQPVIHVSNSQPDFRTSSQSRRSGHESDDSPQSARSHRSQKLDLSRFFGRHKGAKSPSLKHRTTERAYNEHDTDHVLTPDTITPLSSSGSQRSQNIYAKDIIENAKVNVRRPPKGIQHWFEGLDESDDDDLPEVVPSPSPATFRPSLGPSRSRGAPTSRISPSYHAATDYFHFGDTPARLSQMEIGVAPQAGGIADDHEASNLQGQSMLNLSSDDEEEEASEPPSPSCWPEQTLGINHGPASTASRSSSPYQSKINDARSSVFTMQTMMTSGSIPIINGDLFRGHLPAMPAVHAFPPTPSPSLPTPPHLQRMYSSRSQIRSRPPTVQSIPESVGSDYNAVSPNEPAHTMKVTQEEMVLLAMMRRKRVEMQATTGHSPSESMQRQLALDRLNASTRSITSPPMSPSIDMMLDSPGGIAFPKPPSISEKRRSTRLTRSSSAERLYTHRYTASSATSRFKDKALPDAPTPHSEILCELEAEPVEHLAPVCYSQPTLPLRKSRSSVALSTRTTTFNADDPYQLAPDLDFSPLDLLPLPQRMYSPSLTTSRSSLVGSHSSAATPEREAGVEADAEADVDVDLVIVEQGDDDEEAEAAAALAEARKGSVKSISSVGIDVLAAWGALGGV